MTRVRKYKRPEMWDMGVAHSSIMKKVDWSSWEKEELVLVGVKRFLGAGRSRFQPPTHVQTVVETTNQKKKRKKNSLLGFPSFTGELQEHGGGDGTSRVLSGGQLVAAAADHHHQAATLVDLAVQNGVMDARIGRSTGPAAAAFVALDQAEEEEEDKSALKYPSALAAHVYSSPVDVDQELAAAASKDEENITRHYLGSLGITKIGKCSSSSQLRAAAAAGEEEEEEDEEEASYQEGKANPSPFLQLQQQQEVVAGMNAKSLLLAAAGATTKTTTTTGSAEAQVSLVLPLNVLESAEFGQGMVIDNLMSSLPPAAGVVQVELSAELVSCKEPESSQLTDSAKERRVPPSSGSCKLKSKFIPCVTTTHEESDHPSLEPEGSLLHSLYLQLLEVGRAGIMLKEILTMLGSQMQSRFGSDWQAQVKTYLETNPYFEEVQGRYILCELLLMQPKACLFSSVGSVFIGQYCGGGKEDENTLDTKVQLPPWQPDAAACIQSDSPSALSRLPFDSIQLQEEGIQTRRKAYQKTFEAVLNASAEEFKNLQNSKIKSSNDTAGTEKQPTLLAEPSAPGESKMSKASLWESMKSASRKAMGELDVKEKQKLSELEEAELLERDIKCGGSAIPGTLKAMRAKIEAEKGIQMGVRCARKDGSNSSSKWQCPMLARESHTLCEHHIYLNSRKKARYVHSQKPAEVAGIQTPKNAELKKNGQSAKAKSSSMPTGDNGTNDKMKGKAKMFGNLERFDSSQLGAATPPPPPPMGEFLQSALLFEALVEVSLSSHQLPKTTTTVPKTLFSKDKELLWPMLQESSSVQHLHMPPSKKYRAVMKKASKPINPRLAVKGMKAAVKHMFPAVRPPSIPPMPIQYGVRRKLVKNRSLLSFFPQG
ncbi:unnamed protein product [Sphagnum compactum]